MQTREQTDVALKRAKVCGSAWWKFAKLCLMKSSQVLVLRSSAYANSDPTLLSNIHGSHHLIWLIVE